MCYACGSKFRSAAVRTLCALLPCPAGLALGRREGRAFWGRPGPRRQGTGARERAAAARGMCYAKRAWLAAVRSGAGLGRARRAGRPGLLVWAGRRPNGEPPSPTGRGACGVPVSRAANITSPKRSTGVSHRLRARGPRVLFRGMERNGELSSKHWRSIVLRMRDTGTSCEERAAGDAMVLGWPFGKQCARGGLRLRSLSPASRPCSRHVKR